MSKIQNKIQNSTFHLVKLIGENSFDIGQNHGLSLAEPIKKNIEFYLETFNFPEEELIKVTNIFRNKIQEFDEEIYNEILGIAKGANVPEWQIFLLNARSEIFSNIIKLTDGKKPGECTFVFFPELAVLSENWDYAHAVSEQTYIFEIHKSGKPKIITLSEAGIVAKIGINDAGIGLGMNFMDSITDLAGIPFHVQIRKALEQTNLADVESIFRENGIGVSGNVCVFNSSGEFVDFELDGANIFVHRNKENQKYFCHANHFYAEGTQNKVPDKDSIVRQEQVDAKMGKIALNPEINETFAENILFDQGHKDYPLLVPPAIDPFFPKLGAVGTNAFVMLLPRSKEMRVAYEFEGFSNLHTYKIG